MNILQNALNHITALIRNQKIKIITEKSINQNGFAVVESSEVETIAHIQPVTPREIEKIADGSLGSVAIYRFYFLKDLGQVLSSLNNENSTIIWGERTFKAHAKSDWSQNGWIKITAHEVMGADNV